MQAWEEKYYEREDASAEGRKEGHASALMDVISNMLKDHLPLETIVKYSGRTVDEIKEIAQKLNISLID